MAQRDQVAAVAGLVAPDRQRTAGEGILQVVEALLIADREVVIGREVLIDLEDHLVPVVVVHRSRDVVQSQVVAVGQRVEVDQAQRERVKTGGRDLVVGKAAALDAPVARSAAIRVVEIHRLKSSSGSAPGDVQGLGKIARPLQRGRHVAQARPADRLYAPLEADEEETLVAHDRATQGAAKLVAAKPQALLVEEPTRVQCFVAQVLESRAVELIRSRAHRDADDATGKAPVFGGEAGSDDAEFLDRVQWRTHLRPATDRIAVADAIDEEVGLVSPGAVHGRE